MVAEGGGGGVVSYSSSPRRDVVSSASSPQRTTASSFYHLCKNRSYVSKPTHALIAVHSCILYLVSLTQWKH